MTVGQREVQNDYVRLKAGNGAEGIPGGLGFAANHKIALTIDALGQSLAHDRVVVHQQDSACA